MKVIGKLVLGLTLLLGASAAYADPRLDIDVDTSMGGFQFDRTVTIGTSFDVEIHISDVSGLYAYDIDVTHNGTNLDAISVTEGPFLPAGGPTSFFSDDSGTPVNAVAVLLGVPTGVSGSGSLYTIRYTALAAGITSLEFTFTDFSDDQFNPITVSLGGARIVVQGVPLPSTLFLFGAGLAAIAGIRRRNT